MRDVDHSFISVWGGLPASSRIVPVVRPPGDEEAVDHAIPSGRSKCASDSVDTFSDSAGVHELGLRMDATVGSCRRRNGGF